MEENKVVRYVFYGVFALISLLPSCRFRAPEASLLLQNERLLVWEHPDSALAILQNLDTDLLSRHERDIYRMEYQLALSRTLSTPYYTATIDSLLSALEASGDRLAIGEAYYMLGTSSNHTSRYEASVHYLKRAEMYLSECEEGKMTAGERALRDQLLGVTWFCLGNTSESEMLYQIARTYYEKAIPLLKKRPNNIFIACGYRDMARTNAILSGNADSTDLWFRQAAVYAEHTGNAVLQADIQAYFYEYCEPDSINARLAICRKLAEEYGVTTRYAEMVEIFLARGETDSAAFFLDKLHPADSTYSYWYEQNHAYLDSKLKSARNQNDRAYKILLRLYDKTIAQLQDDASARTFAITQHYDVEREQKKAEEAQREQLWHKRLSAMLVLTLAVTMLMLIVLFLYYRVKRREHEHKIASLRNKYVQQLQLALERLQQKVSLTKEIELQRMRGNEVVFPKWLQTYRDEQLVLNKERLDELIASTDKALDGSISRLRAAYPALTESDMQFAILVIIGASDNDMSILLNVQKHTIYHRRQIVRKHVSPDIKDIDQWLLKFVLGDITGA